MADTTGVSGTSGSTSSSSSTSSSVSKSIDVNAFLKLLTAEMKYQDPLDPMSNTESMAQLAQFSALQQESALNTTMTSYVTKQEDTNTSLLSGIATSQATNMIGKDIEASVDGSTVTGKVSGFTVTSDEGVVLTCGDKQVPLVDVYSVKEHTTA